MAKCVEDSTTQYVDDLQKLKRKVNNLVNTSLRDFMLDESEESDSSVSSPACNASNLDELEISKSVEHKPSIQFGIDGQNLDTIYSGRTAETYGRLLRVAIFGPDGLANEMIMPTKSTAGGRKPVSMENVMKFLSKFEEFKLSV